ncbi:porin [Herbaspirillum robiniae]|uniref:Porin n=1 Tax=Herbaspirillum robiniae TaxID=2014887 RepID=A0A246WL12_9BURK|nr:porin [Herbaspirillum robiniae]NUU03994.1 porin [Herbaspirillum robiniae]OWY27020.1 porin [Herbaspirillum robiniae]
MKKIIRACAVVAVAAPAMQAAHAQSSVTIFGTVDGGVRYLSNANNAGGSKLYMGSNGWNSSNKIDIAGKEDLGGGMDAHFLLENGFNLATGGLDNTTNTLFQRQSFVGIKAGWGSIDMGRQYTIAHDFIADYDPFHFNYTSLIPLTQASSGTRFSNDLKYTGEFGGFKFELENSFGENAGSFNNGSARGVGLQYYAGDLTVGASYNRRFVQVGTAFRNEDYYLTGISYKFGEFALSGGYMIDTIQMPATAANTVTRNIFGGASYSFSDRVKLTGGFYKTAVSTDRAQSKNMTIVGLDYYLSKRTKLYVEADYNKYRQAVVTTLNTAGVGHQLAYTVGINHRF